MENDRIGRGEWRCISPTMVLESIPPDRKAPSGTSATICSFTAAVSRCSSSSTTSSGVPRKAGRSSSAASVQYGRDTTSVAPQASVTM